MNELEPRVVDLETKYAHQDHLVGELNLIVAKQQRVIDDLTLQVRGLSQSMGSSSESRSLADDKPPHY